MNHSPAEHEPHILTDWPETPDRVTLGEDFCDLLEELTGRGQDPADVDMNLSRVFRSPTAHLFVVREAGRVVSTATLSLNPILSGEGSRMWIDDVVTRPDKQGLGYSKAIMNAMESLAAAWGDEVYLSSATHRGPARAGYEKRGYTLLNETEDASAIFRSTTVGKEGRTEVPDNVEVLESGFSGRDVLSLAWLLDGNAGRIEENVSRAIASPTTKVFASRDARDRIRGVAVANQTPIPVGMKPWIDDIAGETPESVQEVVAAAGVWLGGRYKHVNVVAPVGTDFGEDYQMRTSGLYAKKLGGLALRTRAQ